MNKGIFFLLTSTAVSSISQMFLKKATKRKYKNIVREYMNIWSVIGYLLMFISTILVILGYKIIDYKNGAVIESLGFIFVLILSKLLFNEKITKNKLIGNIIIIIGVVIFYL